MAICQIISSVVLPSRIMTEVQLAKHSRSTPAIGPLIRATRCRGAAMASLFSLMNELRLVERSRVRVVSLNFEEIKLFGWRDRKVN